MLLWRWLMVAVCVVAAVDGQCDPLHADSTASPAAPLAPPAQWQQALPGWHYTFPADHAAHRDFKTEWWYFTGQVKAPTTGRSYGFELTFFRQGVHPMMPVTSAAATSLAAEDAPPTHSRFTQPDFKFAHLAITDLDGRRFYFTQRLSRGAFGEAGFRAQPAPGGTTTAEEPRLAWLEDWELREMDDGAWQLHARSADPPMALDLRVRLRKPLVVHGVPGSGISEKAAGEGNASHYYSFTRLETQGTLAVANQPPAVVQGLSWFDHEWASNALTPEQIGWDWFCVQFDDGTELMLYAMRRRDGGIDPVSSGTLVAADGTATHLRREDFTLASLRSWRSPNTGANYPVEWQVKIPSQQMEFTVRAQLDAQELVLPLITYWEGATTVAGTRAGQPLAGLGYMELTGYRDALTKLTK